MAHIININPLKEEFSISIDFKSVSASSTSCLTSSQYCSEKELTSRIYNGRKSPKSFILVLQFSSVFVFQEDIYRTHKKVST